MARSDEKQHQKNTKRIGRPALRKNKRHPRREARCQHAYDCGALQPRP